MEKSPEIQTIPTGKLIPYARNAKTHPKEQIEKIARQISEVGFLVPIVVDKDFVVITGHGRLEAAKALALKEVPVIIADHMSEDQAMAWRIADNKVSESPFDFQLLAFELATLERHDIDLTLTGISADEAQNLIKVIQATDPAMSGGTPVANAEGEWAGMPEFNQGDKTSFRHVIVHFKDEAAAADFFRLMGQNDTGITKSLWHPEQERMDTESKRYGN